MGRRRSPATVGTVTFLKAEELFWSGPGSDNEVGFRVLKWQVVALRVFQGAWARRNTLLDQYRVCVTCPPATEVDTMQRALLETHPTHTGLWQAAQRMMTGSLAQSSLV